MRHLAWGSFFLVMAAAVSACGDDTGGGGSGGGSDAASTSGSATTSDAASSTSAGTTTSSNGSGGGSPYAELYLCEESDFGDDFPLGGPGFDPETGIIGEPQETYLVATTQIYVKPEQAEAFFPVAGAVIQTLGASEGMVAWGIGSSETCGVSRTLSVWSSEEAMLAFVASEAHGAAMLQAGDLAFTGRTTHWEVTAEELAELDWDVARAKVEGVEPFY